MNSWSRTSIGDLAVIVTKGTTPTTLGYAFVESGIPFVRVQNLVDGKVDFSKESLYIDEETHTTLKRSQIQNGDLLISIAGTIGRPAIVDTDEKLNCNQAVAIVRFNGAVERRYVLHWLVTSDAFSQMSSKGVTGTITNLSLTQIKSLQIPLPPLEEQKRIAGILDAADILRAKRREALAKLDDLLQSTFLDMFGDPVTNPKGWEVKTLDNLGVISTGGTPPSKLDGMFDGEIPFVTPGDLKETWVNTKRTVTPEGASKSRIVEKGATFVCCIGATIGKMGKASKQSAFNQQINAIQWSDSVIDGFGFEMLKSFKGKIARDGASTTLPILKKSLFQKIRVPLPPLDLQQRFAEIVSTVEEQKAKMRKHLEQLDDLFASLQQRAFRGDF